MKTLTSTLANRFCRVFGAVAVVAATVLSGARASAQILAYDDASGYTTWTNGASQGYGFGPWTLRETGTGNGNYTGFFVGTPGDPVASSNGNAWGLYANGSSGANAAVAFRAFTNGLATNTVFKIKWHTKGIGYSTNSLGGFCLRHGNTKGSTADFNAGARFEFRYAGGGLDSFLILDGNGITPANLSFGSNPFQVEFTLLTPDTYRLEIKDAAGASLLASFSSLPLAGSGAIDSVCLYAFQTDDDQVFNNAQIASTSLTPPQILNVSPANGAIYVPFTNQMSFDAISLFSTLPPDGFTVLLNGVTQANLSVTGSATNRHVVVNNPLPDNLVNTAVFIARDASGNRATNVVTFNTFEVNNPFIEAGDYNYNAGSWFDNFAISQPNYAYQGSRTVTNIWYGYTNIDIEPYGLLGSNSVDYLETDLSGANNAFRPGDLPQTEYCYDVDHNHFGSSGLWPFDLDYNETGEWQDYTRRLSNVTYTVYARMAGFGVNPVMLFERLTSPTVTSANQPRAALGAFSCPSDTGGVQSFTLVPLNDFFGNPVRVRLPGTNTFRTTCIGSSLSYNFAYLTFVPSANTNAVLPYLASGSPSPGAQALTADPPVSFVIANAQSAVAPGTIQLFLNSSNVTSALTLSGDAAGTLVSYQPAGMVPLNSTNTLRVVFSDGSVTQTNQWQFTVADFPRVIASSTTPLATNPVNATVRVALNATINPGYLPTTVYFQFGLTTNYGGSAGPVITSFNTNAVAVSVPVDGFSQGFTYHYAIVASNQIGVIRSPDHSFVLGLTGGAPGNTPPQLSDFANVQVAINTPTAAMPFIVMDAETPPADLSVTASAGNTNLVPASGFAFGGAAANRTLTITPAAGLRDHADLGKCFGRRSRHDQRVHPERGRRAGGLEL
jgi:hypothetical protein